MENKLQALDYITQAFELLIILKKQYGQDCYFNLIKLDVFTDLEKMELWLTERPSTILYNNSWDCIIIARKLMNNIHKLKPECHNLNQKTKEPSSDENMIKIRLRFLNYLLEAYKKDYYIFSTYINTDAFDAEYKQYISQN